MDNTRILKIDQPDGWEVLHCKHLTVTHFQAWGNFSDKEIFDYQASGSLCTCTVRHRQQEHQMPRMNSNSQNHLDVLQYYRFPSQGNYEVYMIACKAEGEQFGARRFAKVRLLTTAHEYTHHQVRLLLQNHVLKIQECRKHSCNPKWSKVYPKHSDFHEIAPKKKGQPLPGRKGWCWAAFTAPPLFFLASERVARSPVAKAFPSLTCQPWDDFKVHATCWYVLPNSGCQWLGSGDLDFVLPSLISASFSETASLKRYLESFGLWLWTSKGSKSHLPWALGYQRDTRRSEVRWSCQPVQQRKPKMHRNSMKMWGTKNFGRAIYFYSGVLKLQTSRVTRYLKSHACPWSRPYQARRSGDFDNGNASEHPNRWISHGLIFRPNWLSWRIDCPNPHHGSQTLVTWTIWTEPEWIQLDI